MRLSPTFKASIAGLVFLWLALVLGWLSHGCAYKHLEADPTGKVTADIWYLFTDQKTSGFSATGPAEGKPLTIKFGSQESQAKMEFLTELLKAYNVTP
jgi:hypothetical protein